MDASQRQVLWTTGLSHGLIHVFELAVPALLIRIQAEFGVGDFAMGRVVTVYGLLFGLGALPAGWLVDRIGARVLLVCCLWGASLSLAGMAWSPSLPAFSAAAACMGLALSIYHPAGTSLITHAIPLSGRVFAWHGMGGNLGVAGASVIAGVLGDLVGWRWTLALLAAAGAALGARAWTLPGPAPAAVRKREGNGRWTSFVLLLVAAGFLGMVYRGTTTFLPKFLSLLYSAGSTTTGVGGALTTLALLVGLLGMYWAGRLVDRGKRPSSMFLVGAVLQGPPLLLLGLLGGPTVLPLAMGVAFFHFFTQPPGNHMVAEFTPPRLRGLGYGVYFFVAFGAGSFGASLGGFISDRWGLAYAFVGLAAVLVPAIAASVFLRASTRERSTAARAPVPGA